MFSFPGEKRQSDGKQSAVPQTCLDGGVSFGETFCREGNTSGALSARSLFSVAAARGANSSDM